MNNAKQDQAASLRAMVAGNGKWTSRSRVVAIASGKGGVGKSSICVNLAIALSQLGVRVLVVDADFGLANIDVMLGVSSRYNLVHLLRREKRLADIIQEGQYGVRFISGGSGVFELLSLGEAQLQHIVDDLMLMQDPVDIILLDMGAGINDGVLQLVEASSELIVVTTPEPTAILDAYALVKTVHARCPDMQVRLVMNKAENRKEAQNAIGSFQAITRKHLQKEIESLGHVVNDQEMTRAIKRQVPILISHPHTQASRDIMGIAQSMMDQEVAAAPASMLSRLFLRWLG